MKDVHPLLKVYAVASGGNAQAYAWLCAWHNWCHAIDDHVDEKRKPEEVVDLCASGAVLFSQAFYRVHAEALGPLVGVIAGKYKASLTASKPVADTLRLAGNDMVLGVAYITGGPLLVDAVNRELWPIVQDSQLTHDS